VLNVWGADGLLCFAALLPIGDRLTTPRPGLRAAVAGSTDAAHGYQGEGFASGVCCVLFFYKEPGCGSQLQEGSSMCHSPRVLLTLILSQDMTQLLQNDRQ